MTLAYTKTLPQPSGEPHAPVIPPLHAGDHLTRPEFERRYAAMPTHIKAELLEGVVYMPSPVSNAHHGTPHFDVIGWLNFFRSGTPGVVGGDNSTLRLDLDSEPQPDVHLRLLPAYGGQSREDADGYLVSAPELIVEVSASSVSYDSHVKLRVYRRHGVREYVIWRTMDQAVDWFILRAGDYVRLEPAEDGIYRSEIFPGLWLDPAALLSGDMARVGQIVQQGIASADHAAFVEKVSAVALSAPPPQPTA